MPKTLEYDIVVVGGGPAGSSAAFSAAKSGMRVALLEKEEQIAQTVRTSGVTWMEVVDEFKIPKECYNPIKTFAFCSPNNEVTINDSKPHAAVLDVRKTYQWLSELARLEGVEIFLKTIAEKATRNADEKIIEIKANTGTEELFFKSKIVIDASGFQTVIAKSMGLVKQWKRFGVGAEYEVRAENVRKDTWWLMVGRKYSPAGYAWVFPVGEKIVRIGVGVGKPESTADPTDILKTMLDKKLGPIRNLGNISLIEFHYGLIPNEGLSRKTVYDNLLLVGDTAGFANPLVLEGIRYAIKFGRLAGKIAADAIKNEDASEKELRKYEQIWKKEIFSKISAATKVQARWIGLSDEQWDRELDIIGELSAEEFLDFIKADFSLGSVIKLATHHPKLAVRQLFNLVKRTREAKK